MKLNYVILGIVGAVIVLFGLFVSQDELSVGSDTVLPIAGQTYTIAGSGITSSATSITLTSFTIPQNGYKIQDSDVSETFYITLEPGSRSRQEIASCTTVTQNADNTATLSGCTRGLSPVTPYTASSSLQFAHAGGTSVIFSDPPQLFNQVTFKDNDETITGTWLVPTPLSNTQIASKGYVDGVVNGGAVTNDRLVVAGNAGETVSTSTLVYFDGSDQEWKKVDVDTAATYQDKFIGLTQGPGTDGAAITGGILLKGRDNLVTGLTAGSKYYASTSAGTITNDTTDSSVQPIGIAEDTNVLYFDPVLVDVPLKGQDNTFSGQNTFSATTTMTAAPTIFDESITGHASTTFTVYTANDTWVKPSEFEYITVWVCGGGGGTQGGDTDASDDAVAGGGGGGCAYELLTASELSATTSVNITVGSGGSGSNAASTPGTPTAGGDSSFGNFLSATGGGSAIDPNTAGTGGTATGGDINFPGQNGGMATESDAGSYWLGGVGGSSQLGRGGAATAGTNNATPGESYGGGAGGHSDEDTNGAAGAAGVVIIQVFY